MTVESYARIVPLRIDHLSKADLGYELLVAEHSDAVKARPVHLNKRDSVEDAFCNIARNCLDQVHANERGVVSGHDPSSVHQTGSHWSSAPHVTGK
ncbi:hypothetical protein PQR41_42150, partial [Paraburkholderia xenovorans]